MANDIPSVREARYRLLGLQAIPQDGGVLIRRGRKQIHVPGARSAEVLDLLVTRSAEGNGIRPEALRAEIDPLLQATLAAMIDALAGARILVPLDDAGADPGESREAVFYWNHGADPVVVAERIAAVDFAIFGVNHVSLPLVGNLRSLGFRSMAFVDHPALRNLDFYGSGGDLRPEIAGALASNRPQAFDAWSGAGNRADCWIVCSDFGGLALIREWNRNAVAAGTLLYPAVLQDEVAWLGPMVVPGEGPCFECVWTRRNANLDPADRGHAAESHAFFGQAVAGYVQPMARAAADIAAIDLLKYFSGALPGGRAGRLIEVDLMAPALSVRHVLKVPRCPVCAAVPAFAAEAGSPSPEGAP